MSYSRNKQLFADLTKIDADTAVLAGSLMAGNKLKLEPEERIKVAEEILKLQKQREALIATFRKLS